MNRAMDFLESSEFGADGSADAFGDDAPPLDPVDVDITASQVFLPGGILSTTMERYEFRKEQLDLSCAMASSIDQGHHLIAEGSTGVGKSIAYLVPAIIDAAKRGTRVVVATANIALQEQLFKKDLPFLASVLPFSFSFSLSKGIGNYFCHHSASMWMRGFQSDQMILGMTPSNISDQIKELCEWSESSESGDRSELSYEPTKEAWDNVSCSSDECLGKSCGFADRCFYRRARKNLNNCHVIVANYHLLFAAVKVRIDSGMDVVLPKFDVLVCDEAHRVADIARSFFGWDITIRAIEMAVGAYSRYIHSYLDGASKQDALVLMDEGEYDDMKSDKLASDISDALLGLDSDLKMMMGKEASAVRVRNVHSSSMDKLILLCKRASHLVGIVSGALDSAEDRHRSSQLSTRLEEFAVRFLAFKRLDGDNKVYYLEKAGRSQFMKICMRMIDVSEFLNQNVYAKTRSTIATSATVAVDGKCDFVKNEIGMFGVREIIVGSPFDFRSQALMILSANAPDPQDKDTYPSKVAVVTKVIIQQAKGRTLGLFTSYRVMEVVAEYLREQGIDREYKILVQGELPRGELIRQFKDDISSVLLGTESFWAGVDVQGEALSCLIIDKIPFPSPGNPILDAIQEKNGGFKESFFKISLPRAILQIKQGVGRLIRSASDRGVVIILDRRMVTKGYGSTIVQSLPPMRRASGIKNGEVQGWLGMSSNKEV